MASVEVPIAEAFPWLLPHPRLPGALAAHLCQHWDPSVRVEMWPAISISADLLVACVCLGGTFALLDSFGTDWRHFVLTLEVERLAFAGSGQGCCWPVYSL